MIKLFSPIDTFLNKITMYRLVLYSLFFLAGQSILFSLLGLLSFNPLNLCFSLLVLFVSCYATNQVWARLLKVAVNVESATITAFILFFIFSPLSSLGTAPVLVLAGVISMSSKYLLAIHKKHLFNPAAVAAFILGLTSFGGASWWIATAVMIPTTTIIGLLIVRKIRRFHLLFSYLVPAIVTIFLVGTLAKVNRLDLISQLITSWPILFFGTIMLTEPLTTPPTLKLRMMYGAIVGVAFGAQFNVGPIYSTPELALLLGNIFSYIVSPKVKQILTLQKKNKLSTDQYEFIFTPEKPFRFIPGQYLEWTLGHAHPDSRGNRRYFTIASSPTESDVKLGVKFYPESSSFKKKLLLMNSGDSLSIDQLAGDFTLPSNQQEKLVFIAGGIGITPFRSMLQYLIDKNEKRDIVLFFANKIANDIIYQDIFQLAQQKLNIKTVYSLSDDKNLPPNWHGHVGRIDMDLVKKEVPDFKERTYYLSGPHAMVSAYDEVLSSIGIKKERIKIDFFPGFA